MSASASAIVSILSEALVLLGVASLLLIIEPLGTALVLIVLLIISLIYYMCTRKHVFMWGQLRQHHEGLRIKHLQQGLNGAKEVKLSGRIGFFMDQYCVHNFGSANFNQKYSFIQQLPRLWLELLLVIGMGVLVSWLIYQGSDLAGLIPIIGVFGAAAFRLMPSVNRIISAAHGVKYAVPTITTLHEEFSCNSINTPKFNPPRDIQFSRSIKLIDLTYRYLDGERSALNGISLEILCGRTVGIIGGSGSGKSTLADLILGLLTPTSGLIQVDGLNLSLNAQSWWKKIGYVPQDIYLVDDTLRKNIAFGWDEGEIDEERLNIAVKSARLDQFIASLTQGLDTVIGERGVRLSGGQRQRIGIARALYHQPSILILDEATSALDIETEHEVMSAIDALHGQKTIIIIAHRLSTVSKCDWLYRLEGGELIAEGGPDVLLKSLDHSIGIGKFGSMEERK